MSRSKEAEVLIIDTSPSIGPELAAAQDALVQHVQQKLIQMPSKSEIGLVVLGTKQTSNNLDADGSYRNISEVKAIEQTDVHLLKTILDLKHGVDAGDWLDAVVVAMDMLKRHCGDKKFEKGIIMITNEARPVADVDQLQVIAQALLDFKIVFQLYRMGAGGSKPAVTVKDESVIAKFIDQIGGQVHLVSDAKRLKGAMSIRSVASVTVFRGNMYLYPKVSPGDSNEGTSLFLRVWAYTKTKMATVPSLRKRSRESDIGSASHVATERIYVQEDDNTQQVDFAHLIKAQAYGREYVPISKDDATNIKIKCEKEVMVLGYMKRSEVGQEEVMGNVDCFLPDRDSCPQMVQAFSAFVEALERKNQVALIRWVRRGNDAPKLYTMWAGKENSSPCLYACRRPFAEDVRPCPFPSLTSNEFQKQDPSSSALSTKKLLADAADKLVRGLDIDRKLDPANEFNPVVQGFYSHVNTIVTEGAWKPNREGQMAQCLQRDPKIWNKNQVIESLRELSGVPGIEWVPPIAPPKNEDKDIVKDEDKDKKASQEPTPISILGSSANAKSVIDTNNPLMQFVRVWEEEILDAHDRAIDGMMDVVDELVRTSAGERFYSKALDCLSKLRDYCDKGRSDEPSLYNDRYLALKLRYADRSDVTFSAWLTRRGELGLLDVDGMPRAVSVANAGVDKSAAAVDDDDDAFLDAD